RARAYRLSWRSGGPPGKLTSRSSPAASGSGRGGIRAAAQQLNQLQGQDGFTMLVLHLVQEGGPGQLGTGAGNDAVDKLELDMDHVPFLHWLQPAQRIDPDAGDRAFLKQAGAQRQPPAQRRSLESAAYQSAEERFPRSDRIEMIVLRIVLFSEIDDAF